VGRWRPNGPRYEFALVKPSAKTLHVYVEPFVRSDYDIRLLGSILSRRRSASSREARVSDDPVQGVLGHEPGQNDELLVNGLEVCTPTCVRGKEVNAYFAFTGKARKKAR